MTSKRFKAMPRFVAAIIGHLFLFVWFRDLALWSGRTREAWEFFRIGTVSSVILVFTISAIVRGTPEEKVAGIILSALPLFCLYGAVGGYIQEFL